MQVIIISSKLSIILGTNHKRTTTINIIKNIRDVISAIPLLNFNLFSEKITKGFKSTAINTAYINGLKIFCFFCLVHLKVLPYFET